MKIKDAREYYAFNSGKLSELTRQLGLGGLAVVWIFRTAGNTVPVALRLPTLLLVAALAFDYLQYMIGSAIWGLYARWQERHTFDQEREFHPHKAINWPAILTFWLKAGFLIAGYGFLLSFLYGVVQAG